MEFRQQKFDRVIEIDLKDDFLYYKVKNMSGSSSHNIQYEDISNNVSEFEVRNTWYGYVGFAWSLIGLIQMFIFNSGEIRISFWLLMGILFFVIYIFYKISYINIDTYQNNLLIIKNGNYDEIIKNIFDKRNDYLRSHYAKIETNGDKTEELKKFKWLKTIGAITEDDFNQFEKALNENVDKK